MEFFTTIRIKLKKLLKNKYYILGITGLIILLISFLGDYYIYRSIKFLNPLSNTYIVINWITIISYLYIILSIFVFIITVLNIEQYYKNKQMEKKIYKDELSTLNNRNYLEDVLNKKLNGKDYYAIMCDIDHFKNVNDTYGHDIGDKVIKYVGKTLKDSIRNNEDYVIRYGGEEFLILINTNTNNYNSTTIYNIFDRIHTKIKNKTFLSNNKDKEFRITISFGINCFTKNIKTIKENIKLADIALYKAKQERNLIVIYNENNKSNYGLNEDEIFYSLNNHKLKIKYIPIKDINNKQFFYTSKIEIEHNNKIYNEKILKEVIFNNKKVLEEWTIYSLKTILNENKGNIIYNITSTQLLNEKIFDFLLSLKKNLILNVIINKKDYFFIINKLKKLKKLFKISVEDTNKDIFILIEEKIIDYLYIKNNNYEYIIFLNKISKNYNFNLILNKKNFSKIKLEKLNNINNIFIKGDE